MGKYYRREGASAGEGRDLAELALYLRGEIDYMPLCLIIYIFLLKKELVNSKNP
jgi:hypothetical protein